MAAIVGMKLKKRGYNVKQVRGYNVLKKGGYNVHGEYLLYRLGHEDKFKRCHSGGDCRDPIETLRKLGTLFVLDNYCLAYWVSLCRRVILPPKLGCVGSSGISRPSSDMFAMGLTRLPSPS